MTGTAAEAWKEFWQIYHLPVVVIPTNRPCIREKRPDRVFATSDAKWKAIIEEVRRVHATGQPLLIGTRSVGASEHLSKLLAGEGLSHQVLNAVYLGQEAQIIAGAGQRGQITVATNMAGRGTDIKLGRDVEALGGLHVLATERHEAGRIDRQLYGRSARQGERGCAQAIVCLEDELLIRHAPFLCQFMRKRYGHTDHEITSGLTQRVMGIAQQRAQWISLGQRKGVLRTDDWLDENLGFAGSEG
jgi:preprotein translocase subunit SecA